MKGKILALCLSILMVVSVFAPVFTASADVAAVVSVDDTTANLAEETFKVPVSIARNPGFSIGNVELTYDSETFAYVETQAVEGFEIDDGNEEAGILDLVIDATGADYAEDGVLCYVVFSFIDGATSGEYEITIEALNGGFGNSAEGILDVEYVNCELNIHEGYHFVETKAPTYTEEGVETALCDECERELNITRPIAALENAVYTVGNASVTTDGTTDTVSVDLSVLGSNGFYLTSFTYEAEGLTLASVEPVEGLEAYVGDKIALTSASYADFTGNGKVATLNFTIDNPAKSDTYEVALEVADASNWDELLLAPTVNAGTVTVTYNEPQSEYPKFVAVSGGTRYYTDETTFINGTWYEINGDRYYFKKTTGYMLTGVTSVSSVYYDFGDDGKCKGEYTGAIGSGKNIQVYENGVLKKSSWYADENGNHYYLNKSGAATTGLIYLTNEMKYYRFDSNGQLVNRNGFDVDSDGKTRLYRDNIAQSGWQTVDGNTYYFSIVLGTNYGAMVTGNTTISDVPYVFDENGVLQANTVGFNTDDLGTRYYKTQDNYAKGWYKVDDNWYFFSTKTGYMYTGEKTISGYTFNFGDDGKLDGSLEFVDVEGGKNIQVNGKVITGWQTINSKRYYVSSKTLLMFVGNKTVSGVAYTFNDDGSLNAPADGFYDTDAGTMYYNNGEMMNGWVRLGSAIYYFNKKGIMFRATTTISSKLYDFNPDGTCLGLKNGFVTDITGTHYYEKGVLKAKSKTGTGDSGWLTLYGEKRYFTTAGVMCTGVKSLAGVYYDFGEDGISKGVVNGFASVDGNTIYCVDGVILENWQQIDGSWYYFAKTTGYMSTGTKSVGGYSMNFGTDGKLNGAVEFVEVSGKRYIEAAGNKLSGWIFINGDAYYCKTGDKTMFYNTTTTVGGVERTFDANGVCTNYTA